MTVSKRILKNYLSLCTEFYDLHKPVVPQEAFNFYMRHAQMSMGPILEPMCGSGRFLRPLWDKGIDIDGVDASPQMLAACQKHYTGSSCPTLYPQFLDKLELPRKYGLVFIPAGSFGLITEVSQARESLCRIHAHMLPQAKLIVEIETPKAQPTDFGNWWGGDWLERSEDTQILMSGVNRSYDTKHHVAHMLFRYELFQAGQLVQTEIEPFDLKFYELQEFQDLLRMVGFQSIIPFKPYRGGLPDSEDKVIGFECCKP